MINRKSSDGLALKDSAQGPSEVPRLLRGNSSLSTLPKVLQHNTTTTHADQKKNTRSSAFKHSLAKSGSLQRILQQPSELTLMPELPCQTPSLQVDENKFGVSGQNMMASNDARLLRAGLQTESPDFPHAVTMTHKGTIFSLRDQQKVCNIIEKRFSTARKAHQSPHSHYKLHDAKSAQDRRYKGCGKESSQKVGKQKGYANGLNSRSGARPNVMGGRNRRHQSQDVRAEQPQKSSQIGHGSVSQFEAESVVKSDIANLTTALKQKREQMKIDLTPDNMIKQRLDKNTISTRKKKQSTFDAEQSTKLPLTSLESQSITQTSPDVLRTQGKFRPVPLSGIATQNNFNMKPADAPYSVKGKVSNNFGQSQMGGGLADLASTKYTETGPGQRRGAPSQGRSDQSGGAATSVSPSKGYQSALPKVPSRKEFLRAIEGTSTVAELVDTFRNRFALKQQIKEEQSTIMMVGRSNYQLPDANAYKKNNSKQNQDRSRMFVENISKKAQNEGLMQGMIYVKDYHATQVHKRQQKLDPLKDYVKNFSELHDIMDDSKVVDPQNIFGFAQVLQQRVKENKVKLDFKNALFQKMKGIRTTHDLEEGIITSEEAKKQTEQPVASMFSKCMQAENHTISNIANTFVRKNEYALKFKQRELSTDRHGKEYDLDPRIKHFKKCIEEHDLVLPILDKIYNKTLCLNDYLLSDGNCRGLAAACELFDHTVVNRVLLNNCGVTGNQLAMILEGLNQIKDCKSIIYKMNVLNSLAISKLGPILEHRLPHHLEELKIIDCKINSTLIAQLMKTLIERSQLRALSLVNVSHSPESFALLVHYLESSEFLEELDLSWSVLKPSLWMDLLDVLKHNRRLSCLSLAFNHLMEDQLSHLTSEERWNEQDLNLVLSDRNQAVMDCFKDFVKYNPFLIHLDLRQTGLITPAVKEFGHLLTRAQSLRVVHLCGNDGVNEQTVSWITDRIKGRPPVLPNNVVAPKKTVALMGIAASEPVPKQDIFQLFGSKEGPQPNSRNKAEGVKSAAVDPRVQWKELRAGLKLRNIVHSKRMNELGLQSGIKQSRLVIQRHLGYKEMIPGVGQWQVLTEAKDECWHCGQHILTLFIWTPRIGQLTSSKDAGLIRHYREQMEALGAGEDFLPTFHFTPRIAAAFNGWHYQEMREVVPFCEKNDPSPPNFLEMCISERKIKYAQDITLEGLDARQQAVLQACKKEYYARNWSRVIMQIMRFRNPLVANAHMITSITEMVDQGQKIYFHLDWLRPGRHTFLIQHDNQEIKLDEAEANPTATPQQAASSSIAGLFGLKSKTTQKSQSQVKKSTSSFYVHEMLATFRTELIPEYHKERHVKQVEKQKHKARTIFTETPSTVVENLQVSFRKDEGFIQLDDITDNCADQAGTILKHTQINYEVLVEIYHWLQSRSKSYPWVDVYTFRESLIRQLGILDSEVFNMQKFEVLMAHSKYSTRFEGKIDRRYVDPPQGICRFMFLELLFRIAKFLYSSQEDKTKQQIYTMNLGAGEAGSQIKVAGAFYMFLQKKILPFYKKQRIAQNHFRTHLLRHPDVEVVFTMNEPALRKIYYQKTLENRDTRFKPHNADFMVKEDCVQLLRRECALKLPQKIVLQAFGMSKAHVVDEFEADSIQSYHRLSYVEFLEFLARVAELYFEGSEMEELELHLKLEYLLDEILPIVGAKRVKQVTVIEEFSESDDDY